MLAMVTQLFHIQTVGVRQICLIGYSSLVIGAVYLCFVSRFTLIKATFVQFMTSVKTKLCKQ